MIPASAEEIEAADCQIRQILDILMEFCCQKQVFMDQDSTKMISKVDMIKDFAQDLKKASSELMYVSHPEDLLVEAFLVMKLGEISYTQRIVETMVE